MLSPKIQTVNRRAFISAAAAGATAGAPALLTREASALSASTPLRTQSGPPNSSPVGQDARQLSRPVRSTVAATFDAIKQIVAGELNVGYAEAGPADGPVVV